mmetsp:Transcript_1353/g.1494  ORF Transcript_1353/g.1494 Transcript_1353/m.1494 type:complete len:288 (-) Transcript_1353:313-1176(-)
MFPQTVRNIVDYCRYELFKGRKDIKLAIIFSRIDQSILVQRENIHDIQAVSPRSGYMSIHLNEKYNRSSVRQTKASVPRFFEESGEAPESHEDDSEDKPFGGIFNGLKTNWGEPLVMKEKNDSYQYNNSNQSKRSFSATGSVYSNASYAPNKIEVESVVDETDNIVTIIDSNPLLVFKNRRHGIDFCFRFKIFFVAFYKLSFLRSSLPPRYPLLNLSMLVILLFLDIAAALMLFLLYEHEKHFQYPMIPFLFIYPFTVIISPLIALTSIFICKASFYRIYLNINALT